MKVLLVEDNETFSTLLRTLLEDGENHVEIDHAATLAGALTIAGRTRHDVAILDLLLPDSSGLTTFLTLHQVCPHLPVIVLTATDDHALAATAVRSGAQDYLIKGDVDAAALHRAVAYAIERSRLSDRLRRQDELLYRAQKLATVGHLAGGIADEIGNPLRRMAEQHVALANNHRALVAMAAAAAAPGDHRPSDIAKALDESIAALADGLKQIAIITRAMHDFAQAGSGERLPYDLNAAIAQAITLTANARKGPNGPLSKVSTRLDLALPLVLCDAGAINEVLIHLLVNAAEAIADRHSVSPQADFAGRIQVSTIHDHRYATLTVSDNGPGIHPQLVPRIFDPFFTTRAASGHTGQGLAITRQVVEQHGGDISCASEIGQGATFVVRLPLC
jgi:signal transduction histidine kinase